MNEFLHQNSQAVKAVILMASGLSIAAAFLYAYIKREDPRD